MWSSVVVRSAFFAVVAVAALPFAVRAEANSPSAPWMDATAMREAFSGVTLQGTYGNGKPFSERYMSDGQIDYREGALEIGGRWSVRADTFCTIYDNDPTGGCYRVKKVGANCYEFYFVARTEEQAAKDQRRPAWTARGSVEGRVGRCSEEHSV